MKSDLTDTHCHIHSVDYGLDTRDVLARARQAGVRHLICVGTDADDSALAVAFAGQHTDCWAAVGLHPHDAKLGSQPLRQLAALADKPNVVAVGECGLDYYYRHSSKDEQKKAFIAQIELALKHDLPLIFHVREAFADFWPIIDSFGPVRGVVHSFTAGVSDLEQILRRDLYVGLNGIMTFTKDQSQLAAAKAIPLQKLLLETDAPFLTPVPHRGTINEPGRIGLVCSFLADLRGEDPAVLARASTANAKRLFGLK